MVLSSLVSIPFQTGGCSLELVKLTLVLLLEILVLFEIKKSFGVLWSFLLKGLFDHSLTKTHFLLCLLPNG